MAHLLADLGVHLFIQKSFAKFSKTSWRHQDVELNCCNEIILQSFQLCIIENWKKLCQVAVPYRVVLPDFVGNEQRCQKQWPPYTSMERDLRPLSKSTQVEHADEKLRHAEPAAVQYAQDKRDHMGSGTIPCRLLKCLCEIFFGPVVLLFIKQLEHLVVLHTAKYMIIILEIFLKMVDDCRKERCLNGAESH